MAELIETSHGPSTAQYIMEHDLPYWCEAAAHAVRVYNEYAEKVGRAPLELKVKTGG